MSIDHCRTEKNQDYWNLQERELPVLLLNFLFVMSSIREKFLYNRSQKIRENINLAYRHSNILSTGILLNFICKFHC
jgi:hypothetical protein